MLGGGRGPADLAWQRFVRRVPLERPLAVAFSGGADSTALLLALARWYRRHARGEVLHVFHVHHGLQQAADSFEAHCAAFCAALPSGITVRFASRRVAARARRGESPEDAARRARYDALCDLAKAHGVRTVLLGQHADDQAETVLLALTRGAGLPGLAAMPELQERGGIWFARPLLGVRAAALRQALIEQRVPFLDDPTNTDPRFTRNRIRHAVAPALEAAFAGYQEAFARTARHAAAAQQVLAECADADLAQARRGVAPGSLSLARLRPLSAARCGNLLRRWLSCDHDDTATSAQIDELVAQIATSDRHGAPRRLRMKLGHGFASREADVLTYSAAGADAASPRRGSGKV